MAAKAAVGLGVKQSHSINDSNLLNYSRAKGIMIRCRPNILRHPKAVTQFTRSAREKVLKTINNSNRRRPKKTNKKKPKQERWYEALNLRVYLKTF